MEASNKQGAQQKKERQEIQKTDLGNSQPVTEGLLSRPQNSTPYAANTVRSLPSVDQHTANRFRANRPAVPARTPVQARRPVTGGTSEFVRTPAQPKPIEQPQVQAPLQAKPVAPAAPTQPRSIAESVTRMAVAAPVLAATPPETPVAQAVVSDIIPAEQPAAVPKRGLLSRMKAARQQTASSEPTAETQPTLLTEKPTASANYLEAIGEQPAQAVTEQAPTPQISEAAQQAAVRRRMPGIDMELPGDESPERSTGSILKNAKMAAFKRYATRGAIATVAIFLIGGGLFLAQGFFKLNKAFNGGAGTANAMKKEVDPNLLKGEGSGRINVLLLGRGGGAHDAPDLTDTIIVASVDPINKKTTLFSLPRDLWVNIPSAGNMKLNAAYETGVNQYTGKKLNNVTDKKAVAAGFKTVDQAVEDVMGINIDYNVMVDFKAFSQAVNTVNGVQVNVPSDLVDPTMAWENNNDPVLAKAGIQVMDGKKALQYVRSRQTSDDFARSQRQRAVLLGLKSKIDTMGTLSNPAKLSSLASAFGNNVQTDLSLRDASRLYGIVKKVKEANTTSIGLADAPNQFVTTGNMAGQSIVLPKSGLFKYSEIQGFVRSQLKDPYILKERAKVVVLNGTTVPGAAGAKADELKAYGYNVVRTGETPNSGWTQTMLIDLSKGKKKYTSKYLEKRLGVTKYTSLPDETIQANGADFVIIIGSDKASSQ